MFSTVIILHVPRLAIKKQSGDRLTNYGQFITDSPPPPTKWETLGAEIKPLPPPPPGVENLEFLKALLLNLELL